MKKLRLGWVLFVGGLIISGLAGCSGFDNSKTYQWAQSANVNDGGGDEPDSGNIGPTCTPVQGQPIPARVAVMSADAGASAATPVFVDDIFNRFNSTCGGCHVAASQGNYRVNRGTFSAEASKLLGAMTSDDSAVYMPPVSAGGKPASQRTSDDPVVRLAALIQAWIAAGQPLSVFYLEPTATGSNPDEYLLKPEKGNALTNIGDCLPNKVIVATAQTKMDELDSMFEQLNKLPPKQGSVVERIGLPATLDQTDLFTLDTETLARHGVISYAPTYPLWSDDAGKWRMVRVPRGQSISFDKANQKLIIPPNTRFYKTFLKKITDTDGSTRYRKVETRLIVSRPDEQMSDGSLEPTALFGTYVWNDAETQADLLTDTLHNDEPFNDRLITYITDEPAAAAVAATNPTNLSRTLQNQKLIRHYAIPGSERCVDCHRGSPSQSFVLGMTPLQVKRRPKGIGGIIEPATADELSQLQRLIDYGVITGVDSPDDLLNLEDSQGSRKPRNDYELTAQGYMVGNCAHCHNPHGDATVDNPVLVDFLNFLPGPGDNQGIFQFPLDRMSPRISRGAGGTVPIPYVTPSVMDYPVETIGVNNTQKADADGNWQTYAAANADRSTGVPGVPIAAAFAPWRSLIYRNVDNPFAYPDDYTIFPHMPKNVPGFDCRLPQIMGDWMVSIPARRKHTNIWEFGVPVNGTCIVSGTNECDTEPQPYEEAMPGDSDYYDAVAATTERMNLYHTGRIPWIPPWQQGPGPYINRYTFCPDTSDIVDTKLLYSSDVCAPQLVPDGANIYDANGLLVMPNLGVPAKAHWVTTDLSDVGGDWYPRRSDWQDPLIDYKFPPTTCASEAVKQASEEKAVTMLQTVTLSDAIRSYALQEVPFGLWLEKPQCDLSNAPTVSQLTGSARPKWLDNLKTPPAPTSHVYTQSPGAAVFNMICINCHGPNADSHGRLAETLTTMTGGSIRVANLRDGLFGPPDAPGANRLREFGPKAPALGISADDLGARYLAWMALGGTLAHIPSPILNIVGNTQVLGAKRLNFQSATSASANMLSTAQELCRDVLPYQNSYPTSGFNVGSGSLVYDNSSLISTNGDAELWQTICSIDNPPPIRGLSDDRWVPGQVRPKINALFNLYRQQGYPANTPVGDQYGNVASSLQVGNTMPWCIIKPTDPTQVAVAEQYVVDNAKGGIPLPFCPDSLLSGGFQMSQNVTGNTNAAHDLDDWAMRGAINAGLAVFLYLDQVVAHGLVPKPDYSHCEQLTQ